MYVFMCVCMVLINYYCLFVSYYFFSSSCNYSVMMVD